MSLGDCIRKRKGIWFCQINFWLNYCSSNKIYAKGKKINWLSRFKKLVKMKCREGSNLSAVISVSSVGDKEWPVRRLRILGRTDGRTSGEWARAGPWVAYEQRREIVHNERNGFILVTAAAAPVVADPQVLWYSLVAAAVDLPAPLHYPGQSRQEFPGDVLWGNEWWFHQFVRTVLICRICSNTGFVTWIIWTTLSISAVLYWSFL